MMVVKKALHHRQYFYHFCVLFGLVLPVVHAFLAIQTPSVVNKITLDPQCGLSSALLTTPPVETEATADGFEINSRKGKKNENNSSTTSTKGTASSSPAETLSSPGPSSHKLTRKPSRIRDFEFISPLLKYGYRPAVDAWESGQVLEKPLLLYLPGFDGTFLSPFLQFPELDTEFDVRCLTISTKDRSTYEELKASIMEFLEAEALPDTLNNDNGHNNTQSNNRNNKNTTGTSKGGIWGRLFGKQKKGRQRPRKVYLAGESFGGILALDVSLTLLQTRPDVLLQGLCLINPATCYDRSQLSASGTAVANYPSLFYTAGLLHLLPLFLDEYSFDQLLLILRAEALPSVVDTAEREAYLGRVALSLPFVVPFMDQSALKWRLREWLDHGCQHMLRVLSQASLSSSSSSSLRQQQQQPQTYSYPQRFPTLIVAGEKDATLPSIDEAERLASLLPPPCTLHVVEGAGHASTCGARVDLTALFRLAFPELRRRRRQKRRTSMKDGAAAGTGAWFGMEPRYDNATIGLNPLRYWDKQYYRRYRCVSPGGGVGGDAETLSNATSTTTQEPQP